MPRKIARHYAELLNIEPRSAQVSYFYASGATKITQIAEFSDAVSMLEKTGYTLFEVHSTAIGLSCYCFVKEVPLTAIRGLQAYKRLDALYQRTGGKSYAKNRQ